jgi:hypothetical protein
LAKNKFDLNFIKEVEMFINKEFEPQLKEYYSKFWGFIEKFLGYPTVFTFASLGSTIGLIQSLSLFEVVFLSGISATVGTAVTKLSDYIIKRDKSKFRNTYSYFLNFRN